MLYEAVWKLGQREGRNCASYIVAATSIRINSLTSPRDLLGATFSWNRQDHIDFFLNEEHSVQNTLGILFPNKELTTPVALWIVQ